MTNLTKYTEMVQSIFSFFNVNEGYTSIFIVVLGILVMIGIYKFVKDLLPW